jgi:hypothetical protein
MNPFVGLFTNHAFGLILAGEVRAQRLTRTSRRVPTVSVRACVRACLQVLMQFIMVQFLGAFARVRAREGAATALSTSVFLRADHRAERRPVGVVHRHWRDCAAVWCGGARAARVPPSLHRLTPLPGLALRLLIRPSGAEGQVEIDSATGSVMPQPGTFKIEVPRALPSGARSELADGLHRARQVDGTAPAAAKGNAPAAAEVEMDGVLEAGLRKPKPGQHSFDPEPRA